MNDYEILAIAFFSFLSVAFIGMFIAVTMDRIDERRKNKKKLTLDKTFRYRRDKNELI